MIYYSKLYLVLYYFEWRKIIKKPDLKEKLFSWVSF